MLTILFLFLTPVFSFYSTTYRKCLIRENGHDIGSVEMEKIPVYKPDFPIQPTIKQTKQLHYTKLDFVYLDYIAAGGSGEVYLVQQLTGDLKIVKRFFKEQPLDFQIEAYIMEKMGYYVGWHRQNDDKNNPTLATYTSQDSSVLRDLQLQNPKQQFPILFYKIAVEVQKAHKAGIIHHDLKMGNILIIQNPQHINVFKAQLIDWNLAGFYYPGYEEQGRKGTPCYYPPQQLLRATYDTPAIDIWALAVVMYTWITDKNPFPFKCKDSNLKAITGLVGSQKIVKMIEKYKLYGFDDKDFIKSIQKNSSLYPGVSLMERVAPQFENVFDDQLVDLFERMLEVDPQYRITISEVLQHPYFDRIKKLPKMYEKKDEQKDKKQKKSKPKPLPANNLVPALPPSVHSSE